MINLRQAVAKMTVGAFILKYPALAEVLVAHQVDFCCGGHRQLDEAIDKDSKAPSETWKALELAFTRGLQGQKDDEEMAFKDMAPSALVDWILHHHHGYLKAELPVISDLMLKVLFVHGSHHEELFKLHSLFATLKKELESHMVKEEVLLFPQIKSKDGQGLATQNLVDLIRSLEQDHDFAGDALKEIAGILLAFPLPQDACASYTLVYSKLDFLVKDMYQHVHLENNLLFKGLEEVNYV